MKIHPTTFEPFMPSKFLIDSKRDAYEANGYEFTAASEAQHQTKLRSRQIAASAVRYQKENFPQDYTVPEASMAKVIEILSTSFSRGTDHPSPFSPEDLQELHRIINSKTEVIDAWEIALQGALRASEQELSFENFLYFDHWLQHTLYFIRSIRAASILSGQETDLADHIAKRFLEFCANQDGKKWDDQDGIGTKLMLEEFLKNFSKLLSRPTDFEIRFFLARFSAERLAVRHECSLQEWLFLFSAIEHALIQKIKKLDSYHLSRYFLILQDMAFALPFAGLLLRDFQKIQVKLGDFQAKFELDPKSLTQAAIAEMLLNQSSLEPKQTPITAWAIVHGQSVFSKTNGTAFHSARRSLCDAVLVIAERNWVDLLSNQLELMARAAMWRDQRRIYADNLDKIAEQTAKNLSEGLESLANNHRLIPDLIALIDHASLAGLYFPNSKDSLSYLRRWFVSNIGVSQIEHGWKHANTIVQSLKTKFRQSETTEIFHENNKQGLEGLNNIENWIQECQKVAVEAWPHATVHSLQVEKSNHDNPFQRDVLWVLRRCLISTLHSGSRNAIQQTLRWICEEVVPFSGGAKPSSYVDISRKLTEASSKHEVLKGHQVTETLNQITLTVERVVLSYQIWEQSDAIGQAAARKIYESLPAYAEKSGEESMALCARDNAMILRRTALSLRPEIEDQHEFIGFWWHNVVSLYLTTRLPNLFQVQVRELSNAVEDATESPGGFLLKEALQPILTGLSAENLDEAPINKVFRNLKAKDILGDLQPLPQTTEHLSILRFRSWLSGNFSQSLEYSHGKEATESNVAISAVRGEIENVLTDGYLTFITTGSLTSNICLTAYKKFGHTQASLAHLEQLCAQLSYQLADHTESVDYTLWLSYFSQWIQWSRRGRGACWLGGQSLILADLVVKDIHNSIPSHNSEPMTTAGQENFTKELRLLLDILALSWQGDAPVSSLLHCNRYIMQNMAPYSDYGSEVWGLIWKSAALHVSESLDMGSKRHILDQFSEMGNSVVNYDILQPIAKRVNGGAIPVFSQEEEQEARWRDSINLLLALAALDPSNDRDRQACTQAAVSYCPLPYNDFLDRLDPVLSAFGDWFVEADLSCLRRACNGLKIELTAHKKLATLWNDLPAASGKLRDVIQADSLSESNRLIVALILDSLNLYHRSSSGWSVPGLTGSLAALSDSTREFLATQPERFERAALNLLGARLGDDEAIKQSAKKCTTWSLGLQDLTKLWPLAKFIQSGKQHGNLCLRDTQWLARRLAVASIHDPFDLENCLGWYCSEVLDNGKDHTTHDLQNLITLTCIEIKNMPEGSAQWKNMTSIFLLALPRLLLARRLNVTTANSWAKEAVERAFKHQPYFNYDPEKWKRDTALTLVVLSRSLEKGQPPEEVGTWWEKSVKPLLNTETKTMASAINRHMVDLAKPQISAHECEVLEKALNPLLASKP